MIYMMAFLAFAGSSSTAASVPSNIEMIIDDGSSLETHTRIYPTLQSCLEDSNMLFVENVRLVKEAIVAKKPAPKDFSVTCAQKVSKSSSIPYKH